MKQCPYCAEDIQEEALVCPHCRKELFERRGWGRIVFGILLLICSPVFAIVAVPFIGPIAVVVPTIVCIIGGFIVGSGILGLMNSGKPRVVPKSSRAFKIFLKIMMIIVGFLIVMGILASISTK
jgi:hypothetical protein